MNQTTQQPNPSSGLSGVKKEHIEGRIAGVQYARGPGTVTVCYITMANGYISVGTSACVDPYGFDEVKGQAIAYENAFDKLWALEGYLLCERRTAIQKGE